MKNFKEILRDDKLLIFSIFILVATSIYWTIEHNNLKVALNEANKPSVVEVKKTELKEMEKGWRAEEKAKQDCEVVINNWNEKKPSVEKSIDELRLDIINL